MNSNNRPFLLYPAAKDYLWGGNRINEDFGKKIDVRPLAETWECSTHPDGESLVWSGDYKGSKLSEVLKQHPEYLGKHAQSINNGDLPIIVKLIDAKQNLSVQVHPNDEYALKNESSLGKFEMWYVLSSRDDSKLIYGFNQKVDNEQIRKSIHDGSISKYLNYVPVAKNDVFLIEPGTIHAIGEGVLVAEVQENSNITYRLYDYDRVDKNGNKRPLQIEKALDVLNCKMTHHPHRPMRVLKYRNGYASELLARCKYFQVERIILNTKTSQNLFEHGTDSNSFHVFLLVDGCGIIEGEDFYVKVLKGDCVFIPADSASFRLYGVAQLLDISC